MPLAGQKRKRSSSENNLPTPQPKHPYLSGNFAPIQQTLPLTPCSYTGTIPEELADGEYVRNGSNPVSNEDLGRDAHWFDGDGMLTGVSFRKDDEDGAIKPEFVNQFVLTDLYLSAISSPRLRVPILPSIATLVNPLASIIYVTVRILRTVLLVILSHLPGSKQKIKKISVANTNVVYHDGRALSLCESGPPMRIQLPGLETVGWYNGACAEGERRRDDNNNVDPDSETTFGHESGMISWMREWTTAHPKIDPQTKEMMLFHSSFAPPYVQYSIIPQTTSSSQPLPSNVCKKLLNAAVPGVTKPKMMHDFGVSRAHTVIMDLPLTLDPMNQLKGQPPVAYESNRPSRFGAFPRQHPDQVKWFETDACCIYHTANTWDGVDATGRTTSINMLACRLTSATLIFASGNIAPPAPKPKAVAKAKRRLPFFSKYDQDSEEAIYERAPLLESPPEEKEAFVYANGIFEPEVDERAFEEEQCRLYYYSFDLSTGSIRHQWALSAIPFEFPSVRPDLEMQEARYVYGCSTTTTSFNSALGKATKIDALVKIDVMSLIERGRMHPPRSVTGVVDNRNMAEVLASNNPNDPISVFCMPPGWFAQEPRFVSASTNASEDDGYLLFYAFDEAQLDTEGDVPTDNSPSRAKSELWIVNARNMTDVVARVKLPQRVPYGLHGTWFSAEQILEQRPVDCLRSTARALSAKDKGLWMNVRDLIEKMLG
jgi:carotenoid cleavage dioxygenase-like enzyme